MRYLVKLTPLDSFFFGSESKYKKKKNEKGELLEDYEADYFQKSLRFPQQTTLLGVLRYHILQQNRWLCTAEKPKLSNAAQNAIGRFSFSMKHDNSFGYIESISPVRIINDEGIMYSPNAKYLIIAEKEEEGNKVKFVDTITLTDINSKNNIGNVQHLTLKGYDEKEGLSDFLTCNEETSILNYNKVFIANEQIGITKAKDGQADDKAFYKQTSYKLKSGYSFAFYAELNNQFKPQNGLVRMGAEKSPFKISFDPIIENKTSNTSVPQLSDGEEYCLTFIADTYIENKEKFDTAIRNSSLSIINTLPFRFFNNGKAHYDISERSDRYNLVQRGSVAYFSDRQSLEQLIKLIEDHKKFVKIGYNQFNISTQKIN
ncbi:hypothetical protein EMN47_10745 [Prolixibacteraceae bacterium JC049]|nr:hypothetical protein [Prolixibacteraceae bacterium JC049]